MSYARERDGFVARMTLAGLPVEATRTVLRLANTAHRLAEAQCNGDWPADNGERPTAPCTRCEAAWAPETLKGKLRLCPDCRNEDTAAKALPLGYTLVTAGDPRGYVWRVKGPGLHADGEGVPTR